MGELPQINISYEELKHLTKDAIQLHGESFQFNDLCNTVGRLALDKELVNNPYSPNFQASAFPLTRGDVNKVREVVWDLIIERLLTIGNYNGDIWPWLSLTDSGKKAFKSILP